MKVVPAHPCEPALEAATGDHVERFADAPFSDPGAIDPEVGLVDLERMKGHPDSESCGFDRDGRHPGERRSLCRLQVAADAWSRHIVTPGSNRVLERALDTRTPFPLHDGLRTRQGGVPPVTGGIGRPGQANVPAGDPEPLAGKTSGWRGRTCWAVDHGGVHASGHQRFDGGCARCRRRNRTHPTLAEHPLEDLESRFTPCDNKARAPAPEFGQHPVFDHAVGNIPAVAADTHRCRDHSIPYPAAADESAGFRRHAGDHVDSGDVDGEQGGHVDVEHGCDGECGVHPRQVPAGLDRPYELAAHSGARGELGLGEPCGPSQRCKRGSHARNLAPLPDNWLDGMPATPFGIVDRDLQEVLVSNRPTHFEFYSSDAAASVAFFEQALGWKFEQWGDQPYWLATTGDDQPGIDGAVAPAPEGTTPHTLNTLDVEDLDVALAACEAAGGTRSTDIMDIPGIGRWIQMQEPGGNVFGLMENAPQENSAARNATED